jgi:hypothetical protein
LKKLRLEAGQAVSVGASVHQAMAGLGDRAQDFADLLHRFAESQISDRDKADYIISAVGPRFYSDLEAIEWAAAVARGVLDRLSSSE